MFARRLKGSDEVAQLQRLLFEVYVHELGWRFGENNPSGLRVSTDASGSQALQDDLDSVAICFAIYDQGEIVGGARLLPTVNGKLEFERYHTMPPGLRKPGLRVMEVNRLVIRRSHQSGVAPVLLFKTISEYLAHNPIDYLFAAVGEPEPAGLCLRLGFEPSERQSFRYSKGDPMPVRLHHLHCGNTGVMEKIITICERLAG